MREAGMPYGNQAQHRFLRYMDRANTDDLPESRRRFGFLVELTAIACLLGILIMGPGCGVTVETTYAPTPTGMQITTITQEEILLPSGEEIFFAPETESHFVPNMCCTPTSCPPGYGCVNCKCVQ